jgi:peptidyl-prolyl cis-trans isomerase A (cyclophilin A)
MKRRIRSRCGLIAGLGLGCLLPLAGVSQEGIFVDFTTSLGSFRCELDPVRSPRAVGNFIALATGTRSWMEEGSGRVRAEPFYDGLLFHRVIDGFMIQSGSPNGLGNDGPGYVIPDTFDPALRHDRPGILSMANSGPNSNGSQFFVTVAATPWLDDVHTVLGWVTEGFEVVRAISQVETDEQDRPREPVRIDRVRIERVGVAAETFDIHGLGLPEVTAVPLTVKQQGDGLRLSFEQPSHADLRLRESSDLEGWSNIALGIDSQAVIGAYRERVASGSAGFFALTRIQYPSLTFAPRSLGDSVLRLTFQGLAETVVMQLDADGGGGYTFGPGDPGTVAAWSWLQEPYRGHLSLATSGLGQMWLRLDFASESAGRFSGTVDLEGFFGVAGTFTLDRPDD